MDPFVSPCSGDIDWKLYLSLMKPRGVLVVLGVPAKPISFPGSSIIMTEASIQGSLIAGREDMTEMLEFAAKHKIAPQVEVFDAKDVNVAVKKVTLMVQMCLTDWLLLC